MTKQRLQSQAGFTLIEVGMGALILVVGFIGLIQAVTIGTQMMDTARKQQIAMQIIDAELEWLRSQNDSFIPAPSTSATISVDFTGATPATAGNFHLDDNAVLLAQAKGFTVTMTRTNVRTNFEKITYVVTWTGATGRDDYQRVDTDSDGVVDAAHSRSFEVYFEKTVFGCLSRNHDAPRPKPAGVYGRRGAHLGRPRRDAHHRDA